jgi:hypothetical protein
MMWLFAVTGMVLYGIIAVVAIVTGVNFFLMTDTRKEIRERKRLKRQTTDHYAAKLEYALYGKVLTGGDTHCDRDRKPCRHPLVENLYEETGKLPVPAGYPGSYGYDGFPERPEKVPPSRSPSDWVKPHGFPACQACNGVNHHWSWCPIAIARREAKPRYTWPSGGWVTPETLAEQTTRVNAENDAIHASVEADAAAFQTNLLPDHPWYDPEKHVTDVHQPELVNVDGEHVGCYLCDHPELP